MYTNWQMDKENVSSPHNRISFNHEKNGAQIHVATWRNLENMLSERSQSQKRPCSISSCIWDSRRADLQTQNINSISCVGLGRWGESRRGEEEGLILKRQEVSSWHNENIPNHLWWWLCMSVKILKTTELYNLNGWIACIWIKSQ